MYIRWKGEKMNEIKKDLQKIVDMWWSIEFNDWVTKRIVQEQKVNEEKVHEKV